MYSWADGAAKPKLLLLFPYKTCRQTSTDWLLSSYHVIWAAFDQDHTIDDDVLCYVGSLRALQPEYFCWTKL